MNKIKDFFNIQASTWDEREKHTQEELTSFLSFIPFKEGDEVLDVACGTGVITGIIYNYTKTYVDAVDISDEMIKIAKSKTNNSYLNFQVKDFYDVTKKYDKVIVFNAFPHFIDIDKFIKTVNMIIKTGGYLIIAHNLSRAQLATHHKNIENNISRPLQNVECEYEKFAETFEKILLVDDDKQFIMLLKRK